MGSFCEKTKKNGQRDGETENPIDLHQTCF